jgi:predicted NBD/HSP70 family sugar kinase
VTRPKTTVRDLRRQNRQTILQNAYFAQSSSRLELSQQLGLSPATVTHVVAELLDEGILLETGVAESQGGRPRMLLTVNSAHGFFVGVDVGETQTRVELFDLTLTRLSGVEYGLDSAMDQVEQVIEQIDAGLSYVLHAARVPRERVLGIGVGVPGIVERTSALLVHAPAWSWRSVPLMARLHQQLGLPIYLDNGAKAMAQAELWFGAGRSVDSLATLLIGTGVGAGIIANGTLYRGATNSAGEWGHTKLILDGWACRCGSRGCIEAYIGALGIIRRFREQAPLFPLPEANQEAGIAAILQAHANGHPAATQTLQQTAHYLGAGIADLINMFNPRLIILGGWVGLAIGPYVLDEVQRSAAAYALPQPFEAVQIGLCEFGQDAVCKGAAMLALDSFFATGGRPPESATAALNRPRVPAALDPMARTKS